MKDFSSTIILEYLFEGKHKNLIIPEGFFDTIGQMVGASPILKSPEWRDIFQSVGDQSAMGLINALTTAKEPYQKAKVFLTFAKRVSNTGPSKQKFHQAIGKLDALVTQLAAEAQNIQKRLYGEGIPATQHAKIIPEKLKETKPYIGLTQLVEKLAETLPSQVRSDIDRIASVVTEDINTNNGLVL